MEYIRQLDPASAPAPASHCFLCDAAKAESDSAQAAHLLLLHNDSRGLIVLNRYPYNTGHLLVAPSAHVGDLADMTPEQRANLMELVVVAQNAIQRAFHPQGMNIGVNIGRCAGAGLPGHLHIHLVPRWNGDTNFMPALGQVRVIPQALEESFRLLQQAMK